MTTNKIQVVYKQINELIAYDKNAKFHNDEQIQIIVNSIKKFGWTNPVLIDENGDVIAGHGRIFAAKIINIDEIPCIILHGLTSEEKKAYRLADNKIPQMAEWDFNLLISELESLRLSGFDLDLTGFNEAEINDLFKSAEKELSIPSDFKDVIETELAHKCPKCGFEYD